MGRSDEIHNEKRLNRGCFHVTASFWMADWKDSSFNSSIRESFTYTKRILYVRIPTSAPFRTVRLLMSWCLTGSKESFRAQKPLVAAQKHGSKSISSRFGAQSPWTKRIVRLSMRFLASRGARR